MRWEIPWIDKAYVFGRRLHHLEIGIVLIFIGWILVLHDWLVYEKPQVIGYSVEFEAKTGDVEKREDGTTIIRGARLKSISPVIYIPKPGSKVGKLKSKHFKPRPAFEKRHWREDARPEED